MNHELTVLCASSSYERKYFFNQEFAQLPASIKEELQIMCVLFTEDVGGVLELVFEEDGTLLFNVQADEEDILYDDIGSALKVKELQRSKTELLEALELFYKAFYLNEDIQNVINQERK